MKIIIILIFLILTNNTYASSGYTIKINENSYDLKIELAFHQYQSLSEIRNALTRSEVLSQLSPNVKSIKYTGPLENYESLMVVKSFGIKSELQSLCHEAFTDASWSRDCKLQTEKLDGGKYMIEKTDHVECKKSDSQNSICIFSIKGKTKPLKILGIQLVSARVFAVKAKFQALNNFFKLYFYIRDHNISTSRALEKFEQSAIKRELLLFEEEASDILKKESSYIRHYVQKELH